MRRARLWFRSYEREIKQMEKDGRMKRGVFFFFLNRNLRIVAYSLGRREGRCSAGFAPRWRSVLRSLVPQPPGLSPPSLPPSGPEIPLNTPLLSYVGCGGATVASDGASGASGWFYRSGFLSKAAVAVFADGRPVKKLCLGG